MLIAGSLLALCCGVANSAAAALEKRETVRVATGDRGLRLLVALAHRRWWLVAMALSVLAWVAEAGALGLAPIPVVTTLRSAGRGGLVAAGHRWLGERFGKAELAGVALLAVGGVVTASSVAAEHAAAGPLSNVTELAVAAATGALALGLGRSRNGLVQGAAVGVVFVATGIFTKEIGDRVVRAGGAAVLPLLASPGPWLMLAFTVGAIGLVQDAFRRSNAASVSAASATVSANGLIVAGVVLYHERLAAGADLAVLVAGLVASAAGAVALALGGRSGPAPAAGRGPGEGVPVQRDPEPGDPAEVGRLGTAGLPPAGTVSAWPRR